MKKLLFSTGAIQRRVRARWMTVTRATPSGT
jgi:hypothetical protein